MYMYKKIEYQLIKNRLEEPRHIECFEKAIEAYAKKLGYESE